MPKPSDERLIAYLDGELDEGERAEIARALERRCRAARARRSASARARRCCARPSTRSLREPLPERLIAAARGETAPRCVSYRRAACGARMGEQRRWWIGIPVAASLAGLLVGGGLGYFAGDETGRDRDARRPQANLGVGQLARQHRRLSQALRQCRRQRRGAGRRAGQ